MRKSIVFLLLLSLCAVNVKAQDVQSDYKSDLRVGSGVALLGTGDILIIPTEIEYNRKLNAYFTTAVSVNAGKSFGDVNSQASILQGNLSVFVSPFKNNTRHDVRIGGGLSLCSISSSQLISSNKTTDGSGKIIELHNEYDINERTRFGANLVVEYSYDISEKFLIGGKVFTQPFLKDDITTGAMIKFGIKF